MVAAALKKFDFFIFMAKNGFVLRNGVNGAILGGSETALSKFRQ